MHYAYTKSYKFRGNKLQVDWGTMYVKRVSFKTPRLLHVIPFGSFLKRCNLWWQTDERLGSLLALSCCIQNCGLNLNVYLSSQNSIVKSPYFFEMYGSLSKLINFSTVLLNPNCTSNSLSHFVLTSSSD